MNSYVYVITNGTDYKIGKADNVEVRVKQLQTGSSSKLDIVYKIECYGNAYVMESLLHKKFSTFRGIGEWFTLDRYALAQLDMLVYEYNKLLALVDTEEGKHYWYSNIDLIYTPMSEWSIEMHERMERMLVDFVNIKFNAEVE